MLNPDAVSLLRLRDPRFVLPFNPLQGPPVRIPQLQPDPAPDVCGFTLAAAPAAAGEPADDDVAGFGRTADAAGRQYLDALNNFGRSFGFFTVIVDTATAVYEGYEGIKKLKE